MVSLILGTCLRDTVMNPIHGKLAEDIWILLNAILNKSNVPRSLVRNGKRSRASLEQWRNSQTCTEGDLSSTSVVTQGGGGGGGSGGCESGSGGVGDHVCGSDDGGTYGVGGSGDGVL